MTYRELLQTLLEATSCQLDQDVTIQDGKMDEFYPLAGIGTSKDGDAADGILDEGHLYLVYNENQSAEISFSMYSPAGNRVCFELCQSVIRRIKEKPVLSRDEAIRYLLSGMKLVAKTHPEINDTEPEWAICEALTPVFLSKGWEVPCRFADF